LLTFICLSICT